MAHEAGLGEELSLAVTANEVHHRTRTLLVVDDGDEEDAEAKSRECTQNDD